MRNTLLISVLAILFLSSCSQEKSADIASSQGEIAFTWNNASIYFLLTDRFNNADLSNDLNFDRSKPTAVNRGFMGGDLKGVTEKIKEGYFSELGVTAIWMTPFFEQIHGLVDEGTGPTYGYHGYWAKDWTALDPNFGSYEDLKELIETAHENQIRIVMDVVINHTGPATSLDPAWPEEWVRQDPNCRYEDYQSTIECTLVDNLPDIRTETISDVALPLQLLEKWEAEGRLETEIAELDAFFESTGYARTPTNYIIKWLTDYIRELGVNAYRLDTAKHTEEWVWSALRREADRAYQEWKLSHLDAFYKTEPFYMVGEVYNYGISGGKLFNFGDTLVDFFAEGIDHLINFEFKSDVNNSYEVIFSKYSELLNSELKDKGVVNYTSSHDDGGSYDKMRTQAFEAGTKLLLCPGAVQLYYGDESARILHAEGANGDAHLRSFMNWEELAKDREIDGFTTGALLAHYQKLGIFRSKHPSVGAGIHEMISEEPYVFKRIYNDGEITDIVVVGLDLEQGSKSIDVTSIFEDGTELVDTYSGLKCKVKKGMAQIESDETIVLLGKF